MSKLRRFGLAAVRWILWWDKNLAEWRYLAAVLFATMLTFMCWTWWIQPGEAQAVTWGWRATSIVYLSLGFIKPPRTVREWSWRKRSERVS